MSRRLLYRYLACLFRVLADHDLLQLTIRTLSKNFIFIVQKNVICFDFLPIIRIFVNTINVTITNIPQNHLPMEQHHQ